MIAFIPDAQTLLTVVASVESGILVIVSAFDQSFTTDSPRPNPDLSRWALSNASLHNVAHVDLLHSLWLDPSLFHRMLDSNYTKLGSGEG